MTPSVENGPREKAKYSRPGYCPAVFLVFGAPSKNESIAERFPAVIPKYIPAMENPTSLPLKIEMVSAYVYAQMEHAQSFRHTS